jgi:hypothetical protein
LENTPRRVITAVLALTFGYGASLVAFSASRTARSEEARGTLLGPLDFASLCRKEHGERSEALHVRLDAYGWRCAFTVNGLFQMKEIDIDKACGALFGGETYSRAYDPIGGTSWQCFRGPPP